MKTKNYNIDDVKFTSSEVDTTAMLAYLVGFLGSIVANADDNGMVHVRDICDGFRRAEKHALRCKEIDNERNVS